MAGVNEMDTNRIITADCMDVLADLPAESVHACVTDPPYGLAFMGRDWDDFEPKEYQEWCEEWAGEVKRVLKPGGHLLAFSGNRTHHRLFTGVEDAGFEVRDTLTWHYGSGFPKASDISKSVDRRGGRVVKGVGPIIEKARKEKGLSTTELAAKFADEGQEPTGCVWNWENGASNPTVENFNKLIEELDLPFEPIQSNEREVVGESDQEAMTGAVYGENEMSGGFEITEPASDLSEKWDGWKTGLKPATEFVVMARKPFDGATVDCVLEHGTGALHIDGCRIDSDPSGGYWPGGGDVDDDHLYGDGRTHGNDRHTDGRYPANVVFDETEAERLDREVGTLETGEYDLSKHADHNRQDKYGTFSSGDERTGHFPADSGGPSRYFYTSKASKSERTADGAIPNDHPTVKPLDLMEWLVRLVTREGQTVLDPFAGSGTTCKAAKRLGRMFIGVERQPKYADIARARAGLTPNDPSHIRADNNQTGIGEF
jgi:DNA modification methylase